MTSRGRVCTCHECPVHGASASRHYFIGREAEVYKAVEDGRLQIDEQGRVWRGTKRAEYSKGRYLRLTLRAGGRKIVSTLAHRLVWLHFFGAIPQGMQVNHLNGIGTDNRPGNLSLVTPTGNANHAYHNLGQRRLTPEDQERGRETRRRQRGEGG